MTYTVLSRKEIFLEFVTDKLGLSPVDFYDNIRAIKESRNFPSPTLAAGAMLPIFFCENNPANGKGEFFFRLLKRSSRVSQAGDIACPGGILHRRQDHFITRLIKLGVPPLLRGKAGMHARQRDAESYDAIALFLATALREAWEEIRLSPFHVRFLGPLPSYSLHLYKRIIFPLACFVNVHHQFGCNYEVEYLVDIPLTAFFQDDNYGTLISDVDKRLHIPEKEREPLPCLIFKDREGRENVIWGATFFIIASFLHIALGFEIPQGPNRRIITKTIDRGYFYGINI